MQRSHHIDAKKRIDASCEKKMQGPVLSFRGKKKNTYDTNVHNEEKITANWQSMPQLSIESKIIKP